MNFSPLKYEFVEADNLDWIYYLKKISSLMKKITDLIVQ